MSLNTGCLEMQSKAGGKLHLFLLNVDLIILIIDNVHEASTLPEGTVAYSLGPGNLDLGVLANLLMHHSQCLQVTNLYAALYIYVLSAALSH